MHRLMILLLIMSLSSTAVRAAVSGVRSCAPVVLTPTGQIHSALEFLLAKENKSLADDALVQLSISGSPRALKRIWRVVENWSELSGLGNSNYLSTEMLSQPTYRQSAAGAWVVNDLSIIAMKDGDQIHIEIFRSYSLAEKISELRQIKGVHLTAQANWLGK